MTVTEQTKQTSLYFAVLLLLSPSDYRFTTTEIASASLYMAIKLVEKKHANLHLMNRELFNALLNTPSFIVGDSILPNEARVIHCST